MDKLFILGQHRVIAHHDILAVWLCLFQHDQECLSMGRDPPVPAMLLMPMKLLLYQLQFSTSVKIQVSTYILFRPRVNIIHFYLKTQNISGPSSS